MVYGRRCDRPSPSQKSMTYFTAGTAELLPVGTDT